MRRTNNLITLFSAMIAFFLGSFTTNFLSRIDDTCTSSKNSIYNFHNSHTDVFLIVLILSAPNYHERRQSIRDTWLRLGKHLQLPYYPEEYIYLPAYGKQFNTHLQMESVKDQAKRLKTYANWLLKSKSQDSLLTIGLRNIKIKHYFAIGTETLSSDNLRDRLNKEHQQYGDLLFLPRLNDTYSNLTIKLLQSIKALTQRHKFSYLLKVDDDSYVKLDYLINELISYDRKLIRKSQDYVNNPMPALYWGYFNGRANIKTKGQWNETNYRLTQRYITYALGGGYVLAHTLCEYISNNTHHLSIYISEDVSLGTWLAPFRHVYRHHDPRFDTSYIPRKCRPEHLILHKRNEKLMRDLFNNLLCTFELTDDQERELYRPKEYYYDWSKTADKCCDYLVV